MSHRSPSQHRHQSTAYWLEICRNAVRTEVVFSKEADLGGSGNDVSFSQAFSNLAHSFLRDKAPSLLDHELGFQVVDRSEDNRKAIGILAAKVGPQKVFVPMFFLKNTIKGHELLYLCDRDIFVPLKESWLDDLINRKPDILGTGINRGDAMRNITAPNLQRLRQSPQKFASHVIPSVQPFLPKLASLVVPDAWQEELDDAATHYAKFNLPTFLKSADDRTLNTFVHWLQRFPKLASAVDRFHGFDNIRSIIEKAAAANKVVSVVSDNLVPKYRAALSTGSIFDPDPAKLAAVRSQLRVVYADEADSRSPAGADGDYTTKLTDEEREAVMKDRVLIQDGRDAGDVSKPYKMKGPEILFNPSESGLYWLLVKPGAFEKCFISLHPYAPEGRREFATVVRLDGDKTWTNAYAANLWCTTELDNLDFTKWFEGLPEAKTLSTGKGRYICIGTRGEATVPFHVEKELGDSEADVAYEVDFSRHCDDRRPGSMGIRNFVSREHDNEYCAWRDGQRIRIGGRPGSRIRVTGTGDIFVPEGHKLLKLAPAEEYEGDGPYLEHSETRPLQPGAFIDAQLAIRAKTAELRVMNDQHEYRINTSRPMSKIAALVHLVRDHGLREIAARELLKEATGRRPVTVRIKYADPYLTQGGPSAPGFPDDMQQVSGYNPMGFNGPTQTGQQMQIPIPELSTQNTDRSRQNPNPMYDDQPFYNNSAHGSGGGDAGEGGQKEVFDTAMISSLLRSMTDDSMVDRWLPDLFTGMDRLGRLLFTFYWHGDRFAERYGKRDMPELEDSLRNAFEMMGDVLIFLQQKTVRANPEESLRSLGLSNAASV